VQVLERLRDSMKDVVEKSIKRTYTNTKRLRRLNERKLTPKVLGCYHRRRPAHLEA